jgi:hypothetical protein
MDAYIIFEESLNTEDSYELKQLAYMIEGECDLNVNLKTKEIIIGERDGGLVIGLTILSLGFTALQTLIATLQHWDSHQPKYSVSIELENATFLLENISKHEIDKILNRMLLQSSELNLEFKVLHKP